MNTTVNETMNGNTEQPQPQVQEKSFYEHMHDIFKAVATSAVIVLLLLTLGLGVVFRDELAMVGNEIRIDTIHLLMTPEERAEVPMLRAQIAELQTKLDNALIPEATVSEFIANRYTSSVNYVNDHVYQPVKDYVYKALN